MPTAADIIVKKADGSTDITYTKTAASGGDNSPAIWHSLNSSALRGLRHVVTCLTKWNGDKTRRRVDIVGIYPYVDIATGVTKAQRFEFTTSVPQDLNDTAIAEHTAQFVNVVASTLMKQATSDGFAPT